MSDIDKSAWGYGPWQAEPDSLDLVCMDGIKGKLLRHPVWGHWRGFVCVDKSPLEGKISTDEVPELIMMYRESLRSPVAPEDLGFDLALCKLTGFFPPRLGSPSGSTAE